LTKNEDKVRFPGHNSGTLDDVKMATDKIPTKVEFLEALRKNGINNLEKLVDWMFSERGAYAWYDADHEEGIVLVTIPGKGSFKLVRMGIHGNELSSKK